MSRASKQEILAAKLEAPAFRPGSLHSLKVSIQLKLQTCLKRGIPAPVPKQGQQGSGSMG